MRPLRKRQNIGVGQRRFFQPHVMHPNHCCYEARMLHVVYGCCEPFNEASPLLIKSPATKQNMIVAI
jgi:hypothetical protein